MSLSGLGHGHISDEDVSPRKRRRSSHRQSRGSYARLTCQACQRSKQKCILPATTIPSRAPLPASERCTRCQMLTKECIPWRVDERSSRPQQDRDREHAQACRASPPTTAFEVAPSHTARSSAMQDALDDVSFFRPFAKADRPSAYPGLNASDTMLKNFLPTASTFLLRHKAFASNIEAAANAISASEKSDQLLAVVEEISMQAVETK